MASLQAIRTAIKVTLETGIDGLRVHDTVPDVVNLPAVVVEPVTAEFDRAFGRGWDQYSFRLWVLVSRAEPRVGQNQLDGYLTGAGATSIRQVIFNNKTLGLVDTEGFVTGMANYDEKNAAAAIEHIGANLILTVLTRGTE